MTTLNIKNIKDSKSLAELLKFSLLNIDKPENCTSFDVVNHIRKKLELGKAGHLGTLDPMVTGVLPICLNNACKIQEYFMHQNKTYIGKMLLHKKITKRELENAMKSFIGKINQLPPRISRVKRQVREREIIKFEILKFNEENKEVEFIAEVQAGTYIRKLIDDLGKNLGIGAQMSSLRRLKACLFSSKDKEFTTLQELDKAIEEYKSGKEERLKSLLIPAKIITNLLPTLEVNPEFEGKLKNGSPIFEEMLEVKSKKEALKIINSKEPFCITINHKIIGIYQYSKEYSEKYKNILAMAKVVLN